MRNAKEVRMKDKLKFIAFNQVLLVYLKYISIGWFSVNVILCDYTLLFTDITENLRTTSYVLPYEQLVQPNDV